MSTPEISNNNTNNNSSSNHHHPSLRTSTALVVREQQNRPQQFLKKTLLSSFLGRFTLRSGSQTFPNRSSSPSIFFKKSITTSRRASSSKRRSGGSRHSITNSHHSSMEQLLPSSDVVFTKDPNNVMYFLQTQCPADILPLVLAYAGPKKIKTLSLTNQHWNTIIQKESTWKVLCKELYKVRYNIYI